VREDLLSLLSLYSNRSSTNDEDFITSKTSKMKKNEIFYKINLIIISSSLLSSTSKKTQSNTRWIVWSEIIRCLSLAFSHSNMLTMANKQFAWQSKFDNKHWLLDRNIFAYGKSNIWRLQCHHSETTHNETIRRRQILCNSPISCQ
jgi:hypothetical protein